MPKILFMGTPHFAVPCLRALAEAGFALPLVVCQPDQKQGRGQHKAAPPVKLYARQQGLEVYQPSSLRLPEVKAQLAAVGADFFVVVAYGKILPKEVLSLPAQACVNVHASLLPAYRGAAPIHFALMEGKTETGVTTMLMDEGMDTGAMLLQRATPIEPHEGMESLSARLADLGAELLVQTLRNFTQIRPQLQEAARATYTRLLTKADAQVDWGNSAQAIYNQFRALSPKVFSWFRTKRILLKGMEALAETSALPPGTITRISPAGVAIACGQGQLLLSQVQPENKKSLSVKDWVNGFQVQVGEIFHS